MLERLTAHAGVSSLPRADLPGTSGATAGDANDRARPARTTAIGRSASRHALVIALPVVRSLSDQVYEWLKERIFTASYRRGNACISAC